MSTRGSKRALQPDAEVPRTPAVTSLAPPAYYDLCTGSASTGSPGPTQSYWYTYQVKNSGPQTATSTVPTTSLPAGEALNWAQLQNYAFVINCTTSVDTTGTTLITCPVGDLASGSQENILIDVSAPPVAGTVVDTATVGSSLVDTKPANNSFTVNVQVKSSTCALSGNSSIDAVGREHSWRCAGTLVPTNCGYLAAMRYVNDFLTFLGVTNGSGRWYLWWSGFFANVTIFAAVVVFYRRHNCHVHSCLRLGSHPATDENGVQHVVCRHHHPDLGRGHRLHPDQLVTTGATRPPVASSPGGPH